VLGDFGGDFRFEAEPVGPNLDALQHFLPENLVARLHIRDF
jgi:hypothetical protein